MCRLADELLEAIETVIALTARQEAELEQFDAVSEQMGVAHKGDRADLEARHKREARRVRVDDRGGLATIVGRYRDDVAAGGDPGPFPRQRPRPCRRWPIPCACNPNEALALRPFC